MNFGKSSLLLDWDKYIRISLEFPVAIATIVEIRGKFHGLFKPCGFLDTGWAPRDNTEEKRWTAVLGERDLQMIAKLLGDQKKEIMEETTQMLAGQKKEIMHEVVALMEMEVWPKFDLLVEKMDLLAEKFLSPEEMEDLDSRVDALEAVTRRNVREIGRISKELEDLKKAQ